MTNSEILKALTLEQKTRLCVGMNFWMTQCYPELGIPSLMMSDGPHGLRKQDVEKSDHLGLNESKISVCYPTGSALACSWDRELSFFMGDMLGREAAQAEVDILLGPAINIKRSPLCGRNFEYYSEDPCLAGALAAAFVRGVQNNGVAACPKHFAANNQETRRKAVDAIVDERTLREIYLAPFEAAVREGGAWTLMSSYNKINGTYPAEHPFVTTQVLRREWGFDGALITDWGAMDQIAPSIAAGLTIQMPGNDGSSALKLQRAVERGELAEEALDRAVLELLRTIARTRDRTPGGCTPADCDAAALRVAAESMVLLKNDGGVLPLKKGQRVAVIGEMAESPRYQGAGSSHVNVYRLTSALDELRRAGVDVVWAQGYSGEDMSQAQLEEARSAAAAADVAVVFVGLPASYESETYDRQDMRLPEAHNALVRAVAEANANLAVVLSNGSAVELPWCDSVAAILEAYLGGEESGAAVAALLTGAENPCGKLAESFPVLAEHNPAHLNFPGEGDRVEYREGVFIGYRYYEKKKLPVRFPFGHGLSYTTFTYSDLCIGKSLLAEGESVTVQCTVRNTGKVAGKEIVQLYVANPTGLRVRPDKELRDFQKVALEPGEEKIVEFTLGRRAFSYYETQFEDWYAPSGDYGILFGASSQDIRLTGSVRVQTARRLKFPISRNTLLLDIFADPVLDALMASTLERLKPHLPFGLDKLDLQKDRLAKSLLNNMTLNSLASYVGSQFTDEQIAETITELNRAQDRL